MSKNGRPISFRNPIVWVITLLYAIACLGAGWLSSEIDGLGPINIYVIAPLFAVIAWPLKLLAFRMAAVQANEYVATFYERLQSGHATEPFVLYLRPHWLDTQSLYQNPHFSLLPTSTAFWFQPSRVSLDFFLANELNQVVVALGTKEMRILTGAISVPDAFWKEIASQLILRSLAIVYVPDLTPGMTWEFEEIQRQQCENKLILLQPPQVHRLSKALIDRANEALVSIGRLPHSRGVTLHSFWNLLLLHFEDKFGIKLREFVPKGNAYVLTRDMLPPTVSANTIASHLCKKVRRLKE